MSDLKDDLLGYLQRGRDVVAWKLEGASEYDVRRPLTPTGTNLLGLVKHLAAVDAGYLGEVFGRPFPEPFPWIEDDAEPEADMWATADESREELVALYRRVWAHGDATVAALDLEATGLVPWWPEERRHPTLQRVLVHLIAETHRHAGHADVVRELVDGTVGDLAEFGSSTGDDPVRWGEHRARVQAAAEDAAGR
ncbi:DinB family protein [Modestobacter altitudinis]|uniref:DinB family protein n=1 Tax=Modestobacter altitudinis TaxID=2213158 RepID=UPI00110CDD70|nr:DinB family protein [Modestobacter altitudinis]